jgi:hypothetical protein
MCRIRPLRDGGWDGHGAAARHGGEDGYDTTAE